MRVLLTGSSGWLGRYLVPLLAENGHKVIGLDVAPGAYTEVVGAVAGRALRDRTALPFAHDPDYISPIIAQDRDARSEEHPSELQSLMRISYTVFCLKQKKHYSDKDVT